MSVSIQWVDSEKRDSNNDTEGPVMINIHLPGRLEAGGVRGSEAGEISIVGWPLALPIPVHLVRFAGYLWTGAFFSLLDLFCCAEWFCL